MKELLPSAPSSTSTFRLRGDVMGREVAWSLTSGLNHLGSSPDNELVMDYEGVSRRHALIVVQHGRVEVVDRRSKNGTFVNGQRIERANLKPGTLLRLGPHELRFESVSYDDAIMAWEITTISEAEPTEPRVRTTATLLNNKHLGLTLVQEATAILGAGREAGQALRVLCARLESRAAVFCTLGSGVDVLAMAGEIQEDPMAQIRDRWALKRPHAATCSTFTLDEPAACVDVSPHPADCGDSLALVLLDGPQPEPLLEEILAAFLGVLALWHGGRRPVADTSTFQERGLRMPSGYIRGVAPATEHLHAQLRSLAPADLPVLISGETGVGKEWLARILHESSPRRTKPLVAINCAAIPDELLEAELFGIGKNVATGVSPRIGRFCQAHGGTLFLDEIGEMPQPLQAKLLRVLQEGRVEPLGAPSRHIDVRVVAATNADIEQMVEAGRFRRDLFFRLAGYVLKVPPLRERRQDIPLFVEKWVRAESRAQGKKVRGMTVRAIQRLMEQPWPGNIRELEHQVRRLVYLCPDNAPIDSTLFNAGAPAGSPQRHGSETQDHRAPKLLPEAAPMSSDHMAAAWGEQDSLDLAGIERQVIQEALRRTRDNQGRAADLLGISRFSLRRRMQRYGLSEP